MPGISLYMVYNRYIPDICRAYDTIRIPDGMYIS